MIICSCKGLNHQTIDRVIAEGAHSVREIGARCGAGTDCGSCVRDLRDRIARAPSSEPAGWLRYRPVAVRIPDLA